MTKRFTLIFLMAFVIALPITTIWLNSLWQAPAGSSDDESNYGIVTTINQRADSKGYLSKNLENHQLNQSEFANIDNNWQQHLQGSSIADTEPPASFEIENGNLVRSESLRAIFDYFLALDGEISIEIIRDILHRYAQSQLTTEESQQVLAAFDEYFDYLDSINEAQQHIDPT
ncbi:MAG: hypothetical protein MI867_14265, partial [Pseudomonadales bacterium]|nr:hypothetical protein [Pseudomonadales bacterium]